MITQTKTTWQEVKLGEIADVRDGTHDTPKKQASGNPLITSKQLKNGVILPTDYFITDEDFELVNKRSKVDQNDVLIGMIGTVGDTVFVKKEPEFAIKNIGLIKNKDSVTGRFIFFWLNSPLGKHEIDKRLRGTSQKFISLGSLRKLEIALPDHPTQKQIVNALSAYDDLIENNTRRIHILERIAQAIYQDAFASSTRKSVPLGEAITIHRGKSYGSHELSETDGIPFVNLKCIDRDGGFRKSGLKRFTGKYKDTHKVVAGDIVMAVTDMTQDRRIVARAARVPTLEGGFGVISMDLVKIEPKDGNDKDYIYSLLRWSSFSDEVKNHANGANVLHLIPDRITDYKTYIAPMDQQKEFGKKVGPLLGLIDKLELQNESLRQSRDLLLPKLVTGEIRV